MLDEALTVILTKLITPPPMASSNGFPVDFNFVSGQANTGQIYNGQKWFPYVEGRSEITYEKLLDRIKRNIEIKDTDILMFHGCSWESAISIMDQIEIKTRFECTDFGFKNFYLTDTFETACIWANKNIQASVVVFIIPGDYIEGLENHLILNDKEEWKKIVYKARNKPISGPNLRRDKQIYKNFIEELDSKDLISGPICKNPNDSITQENLRYLKYGAYIPLQYSFKPSTIDDLNDMLAITLFLEEK